MGRNTLAGCAAILGALAALAVGPMIHTPLIDIDGEISDKAPEPLTSDTMFQASATIMALTVFGSFISIRFNAGSRILTALLKVAAFLILVALIATQMMFMSGLGSGPTLITFEWWLVLTGSCLILIVWIVTNGTRQDPKTSPQKQGGPHR